MSEMKEDPPVLIRKRSCTLSIVLNRPQAVNSLDLTMVQLIRNGLEQARRDPSVHRVLFYGRGEKGFCAGGDVKFMARKVREGKMNDALRFLDEEYRLDLEVHRFPKPVLVLADGITMGGGLGLGAGADLVIATERTRCAMPETRIGFFPDVGATGWLFRKTPPGYPEYLGITGHEVAGSECVRIGLATHLVDSGDMPEIVNAIEESTLENSEERSRAARRMPGLIEPFVQGEIPPNPVMDEWVRGNFAGRTTVSGIAEDLRKCGILEDLCRAVFQQLSERSPTALVLTLRLLRLNQGRALKDVLRTDLEAARFLLSHPDFPEGVRARLIDKDNRPRWNPATLGEVRLDLKI